MKVLWIPSFYPADTQDLNGSFFREQAAALRDAGVDLRVVASSGVYADYWLKHPRLRQNHYRQPTSEGRDFPVWFQEIRMFPRGIRGFERYGLRAFAKRVCRQLLVEPWIPDVIHVQTVFPGLLVADLIADLLRSRPGADDGSAQRIPVVVTEHRPIILDTPHQGRRARDLAHALEKVAMCSAVSGGFAVELEQFFNQEIRRFGSQIERTWEVSPNLLGPDFENNWNPPANFVANRPYVPDDSRPYLHVSNLGPMKNVENLLRGYADSGVKRPLSIVGPRQRHGSLQRLAKELGISRRVTFTPTLSRAEVREADGSAAGFLLPSNRETFGIVAAEALSQGIPVLATPTWGGRDILTESRGVLTEDMTGESIAKSLRVFEQRLQAGAYRPDVLRADAVAAWGFKTWTGGWLKRYDKLTGGGI